MQMAISSVTTEVRSAEGDRRGQSVRWLVILAGSCFGSALAAFAARERLSAAWAIPGEEIFERSVLPHAATVTALVALTLLIALPLSQAGRPLLSALVCCAAAFGPLVVVAAPIFTTPPTFEYGPSTAQNVWAWLAPALMAIGLLLARRFVGGSAGGWNPPREAPRGAVLVGALMTVPFLVLMVLRVDSDNSLPALFPAQHILVLCGWALLCGGLLTAGLLAVDAPFMSVLRMAAAVAACWSAQWAYASPGGAPNVPGWDFVSSPAITDAVASALLIGCGAVATWLHHARVGSRLMAPTQSDRSAS